ncbi:MAG: MFS transporter, partial [Desulfocapsaceae bacterium]|nr:MFS transporter [Desulfocapsaceae bacterium]
MRKNVLSRGSVSVIICFSFSHAVFHFLGQGFSVLIPSIQQTFNITPIEIGALITVREITAGFISLPGGLLSDYLKKHRSLILTFCLALYGIGWLIIGLSPLFSLLFLGMCVIASATSVWHLPAMTELGSRFPGEKGMVFAIFGAGGSIGDILGPVVTGLLLAYLSWQNIVTGYVILPFIMALWTYLMFQNVRKQDASDSGEIPKHEPVSFRAQLKVTAEVIRDTDIFKINIVSGLRGMCFAVLVTFLPLYMHDSGFSGRSIGFHFGLLWAIGLVVSPY